MSPMGGGGSRSGGPSEGRGLVATETLILLPGIRIPASPRVAEGEFRSNVRGSVREIVEVDRPAPPPEEPERRTQREPPPRREQVRVVEVDMDHPRAERRPDSSPRRHAERVRRGQLEEPCAASEHEPHG